MDPTKLTMDEQAQRQQTNHEKADAMGRQAGSVAWLMSGIGPRPVLAPEGLSSVTTPAADPVAPAADPATPAAPDPSTPAGDPPVETPQRPDWLPESLWDGEKGFKQQDFDDLVAFRAERLSAEAARPETEEGYEVALPESFKLPDHIKLADGQQIVDPADPRIAGLRKLAHEKGWSQQDFADVLAFGVNMDIAGSDRHVENLKAEMSKLGGRAKQRVDAVTDWLGAKLGKRAGGLIGKLTTAEDIAAFETIISLNRGSVPGSPGAGRDTGKQELSDEEYEKMSPSAKINYARQHGKK